jgi:2-polyprenyl-6-hydroxyphenyl methylase/3-demethylubiquinone-9 3-methyltransferase
VCSFDYDPQSVGCTRELRRRFHPDCESWEVFQGSALDRSFLASLGRFDVVYSWGVLHHTGKMWDALGAVAERVKPGGLLAVAIYNDQGLRSRLWLKVKQIYCSGILGRFAVCFLFMPYFAATGLGYDLLVRQNPLARYRRHTARGMSVTRDWFDWLGGLPFEVAKPEQIFRFYRERGFELLDFTSVAGRVGCNEFLFRRTVDVQKK